jgi:hypothetical protein
VSPHRGNPYAGAIVLGFQLEFLIEHEINLHRDMHSEAEFIARHKLHYSNYQLTFANALLPNEVSARSPISGRRRIVRFCRARPTF